MTAPSRGRAYTQTGPIDGYQLQQALELPFVQAVAFAKLYAAPAKPFDGMTVYADGTTWNPGGGEGVYTWYAAAWNRLG